MDLLIWNHKALDATTVSGSFCAPHLSSSLFEGEADTFPTAELAWPTGDTWALWDLGLAGVCVSIGMNLGLSGRDLAEVGDVDVLFSNTCKDFSEVAPASWCMTSTLAVCESCLRTVLSCSFSSRSCLLREDVSADARLAMTSKPAIQEHVFNWRLQNWNQWNNFF